MPLPSLVFEDFMLPCLNKQVLGMPCPGCGIQRSISLILQGEFYAAFLMYPAIYPILALFGFLFLDAFFKIKYASKITIGLMITSVVFILGNFLIQLIN